MRAKYKNKRDFYKKEMEFAQAKAADLEKTLERERKWKREEEEKKEKEKKEDVWYDVLVYCENCEEVNSYRVRKGVSINEAGCINCKVIGKAHHVKLYPGVRKLL